VSGAFKATQRHVTVGGMRVRVSAEGSGEPLVMLMGIGGHIDMWRPIADRLPGRRLVMFDFPGTGESTLPRFPPNMASSAFFVRQLLSKLGISRADVLGYSWGGLLAQQLAAQYPGTVGRLILACTGPGVLSVPARPRVAARMLTPRRYYSPEYLATIAADTYGGRFRREPTLIAAEVGRRMAHPPTLTGYLFQLVAAGTFATIAVAPRIQQPTLILAGDDDPIVRTANQHILHGLLRNSQLCILEGQGHLVLLDSSELSGPIVSSFLDGDGERT
jgi:pimeloyl-ACP methyl ester carboxylesterase